MKRILQLIYILPFIALLGIGLPTYAQSGTAAPDGIVAPRLTTTQRNAIASPSTGQLIYNTDKGCFNIYTQASVWQSLCAFDRPLSNTWTRKADLPNGDRRDGVGFSIGSKGYIGLGANFNAGRLSDFWEYDPIADAYTQKADFPDGVRAFAVGFAIGNKGYVGTGFDDNIIYKKDFWEYNPAGNVWTQKADFGGTPRTLAVGFAIGNKGYIGTGLDVLNNNTNDFWEYDPTSNQWTQKANLGTADSTKRREAFGLSIGNKGYIGGGFFVGNTTTKMVPNDFWEYDPASNQWTEKANIPNTLVANFKLIRRPMAFSILDKGFICGGYHANGALGGDVERNSAQEYNPLNNQWSRIADFGGGIRHSGVAFTIANKGYVGFGVRNATGGFAAAYNDLWTYGGSAEVTQQGNSFNQANQLVKLDALGNLAISGMVVSEPFINATLTNGWSNYGSGFATAAYYKDKRGIVHLKGLVKNGTGAIFTLPEGYRTSFSLRFNVLNSDAYGQINIIGFNGGLTGIGQVSVVAGGNAFVSLNGISFKADR